MHDVAIRLEEISGKLDLYINAFDFKHEQVEEDVVVLIEEFEDSASQSSQAFIAAMRSAEVQYRDAIDALQIAKQRLEQVLQRL
jgi:hypothetical protein